MTHRDVLWWRHLVRQGGMGSRTCSAGGLLRLQESWVCWIFRRLLHLSQTQQIHAYADHVVDWSSLGGSRHSCLVLSFVHSKTSCTCFASCAGLSPKSTPSVCKASLTCKTQSFYISSSLEGLLRGMQIWEDGAKKHLCLPGLERRGSSLQDREERLPKQFSDTGRASFGISGHSRSQ